MNIAIGSDHGGYELKEALRRRLEEQGHQLMDAGCFGEAVDYPAGSAPLFSDTYSLASYQVEIDGLPEAVTEVYQASNGAGYTFSIVAQGYGGKNTLKMAVGIDMDGKITGVKVLSHSETAGLGSKITTDENFCGQFPGLDAAGAANADTISGATFSSNYYKAALADAFTAFDMVKG